MGVADRRRHGGQPDLELVDRDGVPLVPDLGQLVAQLGEPGDRLGGVRGSAPRRLLELRLVEAAEQHLAVAGRVQRDVLADPVVGLQRRGAGDLVEVERGAVGEHGDVDRLAGVGGELAADRARLLHEVEPGRGGAGEPEDADAEPVLAAVARLLDEPVRLERRHQPERRALVDAELAGDLGDPGLADARASTSRMLSARSTDWTPAASGAGLPSAVAS